MPPHSASCASALSFASPEAAALAAATSATAAADAAHSSFVGSVPNRAVPKVGAVPKGVVLGAPDVGSVALGGGVVSSGGFDAQHGASGASPEGGAVSGVWVKASVRAKVEHPFRVIQRQFGYVKVRYRGLAKNTAQLITLFALSNIWMVRSRLMQRAQG
jgi:IS5 family transposase